MLHGRREVEREGAAGQVSGTAEPAGSPAFSAGATQRQLGGLGPQVGGQQLKLIDHCRCVGIFLQCDGRKRFWWEARRACAVLEALLRLDWGLAQLECRGWWMPLLKPFIYMTSWAAAVVSYSNLLVYILRRTLLYWYRAYRRLWLVVRSFPSRSRMGILVAWWSCDGESPKINILS